MSFRTRSVQKYHNAENVSFPRREGYFGNNEAIVISQTQRPRRAQQKEQPELCFCVTSLHRNISSDRHMAATPPLSFPSSQNPNSSNSHSHALKHSSSISISLHKFTGIQSSKKIRRQCSKLRCEITSFEFDKPKNWADPLRVIPTFSHSSSSMSMTAASASAMDSPVKNTKKVCLFYCAETKALAERVAAESDAIELRSINWR